MTWRRLAGLLLVAAVVLPVPLAVAPAALADGIRTPRNPSYTVRLTGDATGTVWTGHISVAFANPSVDPLGDVNLRLWGNARGSCRSAPVTVTHVTGGRAGPLTVGCTSLRVALATRLRRGQSAVVGFDVTIRVPPGAGRFGRSGPYRYLGGALPVLAVRDGAGWHREPPTRLGPHAYTVAGDFSVTLDHPSALLVPATGTASDAPGAPGRTVTTVTASGVRDFAWAAGPFVRTSGVTGAGTVVNVYRTAGVAAGRAAALTSVAARAMDTYAQFGAYPYGEVDVVLDGRLGEAGTAYPGVVFGRPETLPLARSLARQWWYGVVGSDGYGSPWLDEAFSAYAADLYLGRTGAGCGRRTAWASRDEKVTNSMAYWEAHPGRYATVVAGYGSCALHDLRRALGAETMRTLLRTYARATWDGVATTAVFTSHAQAVSPAYLSAFWRTHRIAN
ncbi:hypothetical protein GCM10009530_67440 [Microbispora corallina]|uniref:Metallopeptidase n=1 Tax=Microbispora corallina TaxID=83302 RepID=A0ABQ4G9J0_9ACTN|nr:M1 family metallopeptidase [Microbispora corallina]GIH43745.1 hypothetical protein Mco01_67450 [Microbispora corallina]